MKATDKEQLISDGSGLVIRIRSKYDGGTISFRLAYRIADKQRWITLEAKALAAARAERDQTRVTECAIWGSNTNLTGRKRTLRNPNYYNLLKFTNS